MTKIRAFAGKCGQKISTSVGLTKIRAFAGKCGQKISTSVGGTKIRAFAGKCGQKISTSVGGTKIRAFAGKCGQNCANLLCRNNISRASPENKKLNFYFNQEQIDRLPFDRRESYKPCSFGVFSTKI